MNVTEQMKDLCLTQRDSQRAVLRWLSERCAFHETLTCTLDAELTAEGVLSTLAHCGKSQPQAVGRVLGKLHFERSSAAHDLHMIASTPVGDVLQRLQTMRRAFANATKRGENPPPALLDRASDLLLEAEGIVLHSRGRNLESWLREFVHRLEYHAGTRSPGCRIEALRPLRQVQADAEDAYEVIVGSGETRDRLRPRERIKRAVAVILGRAPIDTYKGPGAALLQAAADEVRALRPVPEPAVKPAAGVVWHETTDIIDEAPAIRCTPDTGIVVDGPEGPVLTICPDHGGDVSEVLLVDVLRWWAAYVRRGDSVFNSHCLSRVINLVEQVLEVSPQDVRRAMTSIARHETWLRIADRLTVVSRPERPDEYMLTIDADGSKGLDIVVSTPLLKRLAYAAAMLVAPKCEDCNGTGDTPGELPLYPNCARCKGIGRLFEKMEP